MHEKMGFRGRPAAMIRMISGAAMRRPYSDSDFQMEDSLMVQTRICGTAGPDSDSSLSLAPVSQTAAAIIERENVPISSIKYQAGCPGCSEAALRPGVKGKPGWARDEKLPARNSQAAAQINIMTLLVHSDTFLINNKSEQSDRTIAVQSFSFKIHLMNKLSNNDEIFKCGIKYVLFWNINLLLFLNMFQHSDISF